MLCTVELYVSSGAGAVVWSPECACKHMQRSGQCSQSKGWPRQILSVWWLHDGLAAELTEVGMLRQCCSNRSCGSPGLPARLLPACCRILCFIGARQVHWDAWQHVAHSRSLLLCMGGACTELARRSQNVALHMVAPKLGMGLHGCCAVTAAAVVHGVMV